AAIAARDADALSAVFAPEGDVLDHTTGTTGDRGGGLRSFRYLLRAEEPRCRHEPLVTLGDSLALFRQWVSASGVAGEKFDVGAYEIEMVNLTEVDEQGRWRTEIFATDHLGDAVARLYERYAELLPEGAERDGAAATARSVAGVLGPPDLDRYAASLSPAVEVVDHRILGTWSARGAEEMLRHWSAHFDLGHDVTVRYDDVLASRPEALLLSQTWSGTDRASGGIYESETLSLFVYGADGLVTRIEIFNPGRPAEALARFDELTSEAGPFASPAGTSKNPPRRVRLNAATAHAARAEAAIAARDADAFSAMYADESESVDHTTGATLDRRGILGSFRALLKAGNPTLVREML